MHDIHVHICGKRKCIKEERQSRGHEQEVGWSAASHTKRAEAPPRRALRPNSEPAQQTVNWGPW